MISIFTTLKFLFFGLKISFFIKFEPFFLFFKDFFIIFVDDKRIAGLRPGFSCRPPAYHRRPTCQISFLSSTDLVGRRRRPVFTCGRGPSALNGYFWPRRPGYFFYFCGDDQRIRRASPGFFLANWRISPGLRPGF